MELEVGVQPVWEKSLDKKLKGGKMGFSPLVEKLEGKRLSMIW